jgi:hypothetical protein
MRSRRTTRSPARPCAEIWAYGFRDPGHYVLGFGEDRAGELYVLTTDQTGPAGTAGKVYRLVRPSG